MTTTLTLPARAKPPTKPTVLAPVQGTTPDFAAPMLALAADILDDLESTRVANSNRLDHLTGTGTDKDGQMRGLGLSEEHPQVAALAAIIAGIRVLEHQAELTLGRELRVHPLGPWVKRSQGVGPKQGARLLASIGDPYWNTLHDRPRTVSELWAYCGYHVLPGGGDTSQSSPDTQPRPAGVAAARAKGQRANWSADARKRAHLVAAKCVMQVATGGRPAAPYRLLYDIGRAKYADSTHKNDCRRCGPKGKPALVGSPLSDGHKHARAVRLVAKEVLKDLWIESKRIHEETTHQQETA